MQIKSLDMKGLFFVVLLVALGAVMLRLMSPFMDTIIIGLVIVQLFYPVYKTIYNRFKFKAVAAFSTTVLAFILLIIPIILVGFLAVFEIAGVVNSLQSAGAVNGNQATISTLELRINEFIQGWDNNLANSGMNLKQLLADANLVETTPDNVFKVNLNALTLNLLNVIKDSLAPALTGIISGGLNAAFFGFLLIITLLYLFTDYQNLPKLLSKVSPLDDKIDKLLIHKFTETNRAVILGSFLVAIAQASAVSILMIIMGIGAPVLLWMIMVIFSLIPVGSGVVWLPAGIILILTGRVLEGVFLIVYGAIIINVIDSYLRPKIMKDKVELHPLIIIFSALGGLTAFGPLGILYGPVIAVFFSSLMEIYIEHYSTKEHVIKG
jgi:predicted PurR-regulated permease PerM